MHRIFLLESSIKTGILTITSDKARYLTGVLRCNQGDCIVITDNKGNSYKANIISATKKEVLVKIIEKLDINTESSLHITLLQGLLKGEKMDIIIQKATELGVKEIIPVVTERSQIRETRKLSRWRKIAEEASRQSGRNAIPEIFEHIDFKRLFIDSIQISGSGILFWELSRKRLSEIIESFDHPDKISLFTGPEGGFSETEVNVASKNGFVIASLGKRTLRAETASIAAVSIIQHEFGDL
jgi:16S rRNA (uracil1498-N3)-methyltransferase